MATRRPGKPHPMQGQAGPFAGCPPRSRSAAQMDGCSRQNPAYRSATERPRSGGAFLYPEKQGTRQGRSDGRPWRSLWNPLGASARPGPVTFRTARGSITAGSANAGCWPPPDAAQSGVREGSGLEDEHETRARYFAGRRGTQTGSARPPACKGPPRPGGRPRRADGTAGRSTGTRTRCELPAPARDRDGPPNRACTSR